MALDYKLPCEDAIYAGKKSPSSLEPLLEEIVWREERSKERGRWLEEKEREMEMVVNYGERERGLRAN